MAQDDELAEAAADDVAKAGPPAGPALTEFGITEEILAQIRDALGVLNTNLIAVNLRKGKPRPKPPQQFPRPRTARDRFRRRQTYRDFLEIVEQVAPHDRSRFN